MKHYLYRLSALAVFVVVSSILEGVVQQRLAGKTLSDMTTGSFQHAVFAVPYMLGGALALLLWQWSCRRWPDNPPAATDSSPNAPDNPDAPVLAKL